VLRQRLGGAVQFEGVGGQSMARQGLTSLFPIEELSIIGLAGVVTQLPRVSEGTVVVTFVIDVRIVRWYVRLVCIIYGLGFQFDIPLFSLCDFAFVVRVSDWSVCMIAV